MLGKEHLETMNSVYNLGRCLIGLGDNKQGTRLLQWAASTSTRVLGETHPSTQHFASGLREAVELHRVLVNDAVS